MTEPGAHASSFNVAAEAYDRHVGRYSGALARELLRLAGVEAGDRCLDVGCGTGGLTRELITVAGAANVAAVDPSPSFVAACRARFPEIVVEQAAAAAMPFVDGSFAASLAQLVVNFLPDGPAGVREMARVTRRGGVVGAAVWDYRDGMTLLRTFWDAAVALDPAAEASDEASSMRYSTPDELSALWSLAGLHAVRTSTVSVAAGYADFDDLWYAFEQGVGPAGAYTIERSVSQRRALRAELRRRLRVGAGPFELAARAFLVTGRVSR
jgi:SAM-dependent methyltransferase